MTRPPYVRPRSAPRATRRHLRWSVRDTRRGPRSCHSRVETRSTMPVRADRCARRSRTAKRRRSRTDSPPPSGTRSRRTRERCRSRLRNRWCTSMTSIAMSRCTRRPRATRASRSRAPHRAEGLSRFPCPHRRCHTAIGGAASPRRMRSNNTNGDGRKPGADPRDPRGRGRGRRRCGGEAFGPHVGHPGARSRRRVREISRVRAPVRFEHISGS